MKTTLIIYISMLITGMSYFQQVNAGSLAVASDLNHNNSITSMGILSSGDGDKATPEKSVSKENKSRIPEKSSPKAAVPPELSYLKFNVDKFAGKENSEITELPEPEFSYLKFDINAITNSVSSDIGPLPDEVNELNYLKFDINQFLPAALATELPSGELPVSE